MTVDRTALEALARDDLVSTARGYGVKRPEVMTRVELVDEILRLSTPNPVERRRVRGWLGVARDLVASVVDRGLHLPDAAAFIRGDVRYEPLRTPQPPVATVTLAEIYGAQGHLDRAVATLDEVIANEPELHIARTLRERFAGELSRRPRVHAARSADTSESEPPPPDSAPTEAAQETSPEVERAGDSVAALSRTGPSSCAIYYDVSSGAGADAAHVVRVVELRPGPGRAERVEQDLTLSSLRGTTTVSGLASGSIVRAAIGVRSNGSFRAVAVAAELSFTDDGPKILWVPRPGADRDRFLRVVTELVGSASSEQSPDR